MADKILAGSHRRRSHHFHNLVRLSFAYDGAHDARNGLWFLDVDLVSLNPELLVEGVSNGGDLRWREHANGCKSSLDLPLQSARIYTTYAKGPTDTQSVNWEADRSLFRNGNVEFPGPTQALQVYPLTLVYKNKSTLADVDSKTLIVIILMLSS